MENEKPKFLQFDATGLSALPTKEELEKIFSANGQSTIEINADDTIRILQTGDARKYNPIMFFIESDKKFFDGIDGWKQGTETQLTESTVAIDLAIGAFAYPAYLACNDNFDKEIARFPIKVNVIRVNAALAIAEAAIKDKKVTVKLPKEIYSTSMVLSASDAQGPLAEAVRVLVDSKWQVTGVKLSGDLPDLKHSHIPTGDFDLMGPRIEEGIASGAIDLSLSENEVTLDLLKRDNFDLLESVAILNTFFKDEVSVSFVKS